jgi:hypothetical protein
MRVQVRALQEPHPRVVSCRRLQPPPLLHGRTLPRTAGPANKQRPSPPAVCRERAAKALEGIVTVAAVDADAHKELGSEVRLPPLLPDCCCAV